MLFIVFFSLLIVISIADDNFILNYPLYILLGGCCTYFIALYYLLFPRCKRCHTRFNASHRVYYENASVDFCKNCDASKSKR